MNDEIRIGKHRNTYPTFSESVRANNAVVGWPRLPILVQFPLHSHQVGLHQGTLADAGAVGPIFPSVWGKRMISLLLHLFRDTVCSGAMQAIFRISDMTNACNTCSSRLGQSTLGSRIAARVYDTHIASRERPDGL